jgi:hypothetical protein
MPLYNEQVFNTDDPYQNAAYNSYQENIYDGNVVEKSNWAKTEGDKSVYTRPITYGTREFDTQEELDNWLKNNPTARNYNGKAYQQTGDYNFTTPVLKGSKSQPVTPPVDPQQPVNPDPVTLQDPQQPVQETPTPESEEPGYTFDYSPELRANFANLMGSLWSSRPKVNGYSPFKLPTNHLIRPIDQPAMQNSMMNNVYSNVAFSASQKNLPAYLQQAYMNDATAKVTDKLPLAAMTDYYSKFSNQQIQDQDAYNNNVYNNEKSQYLDQRKALDNIYAGLEKSRNERLKAFGKYLGTNAKIQTETPWAFIQAGMKPKFLGDGKWRGTYDTSMADARMALAQASRFKDLSDDEIEEEYKKRKSKKNNKPT